MSTVVKDTSRTVVTAQGELNGATTGALRQELSELVAEGHREIVLDLARVQGIDAVGIGVLCAAHNSLKREEGVLSIINASPELETILRRIGLSRHVSLSTEE
jgi:serine/threonine-protein kinase RsbW